MNSLNAGLKAILRRPGLLARRARRDESGAALVQFIVVLPVFVLIVIGLWAMFQVFSAQQTLCEAVWESSRYLQVEGPRFPDEDPYLYPEGWEQVAVDIINTELKSNANIPVGPLLPDDVEISPDAKPISPQDSQSVSADNVPNNWFFVQASTVISNPLAILVPGTAPGGGLKLTCKGTAFYEGAPVGPTNQNDDPKGDDCREPARFCTVGPPGQPTLTPTPCDPNDQNCGCAVCRPRR
jgi:hypothetical protein